MSLSSGLQWNNTNDGGRARAEYDYTAAQDDELSFRQGHSALLEHLIVC